MAAVNPTAQNKIRGLNPDSITHSSGKPVIECDPFLHYSAQNQIRGPNPDSTTQSFGEPTTECLPFSPAYSSESEDVYSSDPEDVYILDPEDEKDNIPYPRLELIDEQFNLRMKKLFSQAFSGQLVPSTVKATLQDTTSGLLQHLAKSHPLTWISHVKSAPEEDELPLWMSILKDDIDVLVTQFQQQMYTGFRKMMSEMVTLYYKKKQ